jgi:hypothetical protein
MATQSDFVFYDNEDILIPVEFSGLSAHVRLDDYEIHAHVKLYPYDDDPVVTLTDANGRFAIVDAKRCLAEINIPYSEAADLFAGGGRWMFDVVLINRVSGARVNVGRRYISVSDGVTRVSA